MTLPAPPPLPPSEPDVERRLPVARARQPVRWVAHQMLRPPRWLLDAAKDWRWLMAVGVILLLAVAFVSPQITLRDKNEQIAVLRDQRTAAIASATKANASADRANNRADRAETRTIAVTCDDIEPLKQVAAFFARLIFGSENATTEQKKAAAPYVNPLPRPKGCPPPDQP